MPISYEKEVTGSSLEVTFTSKQVNSQINHQDLERLSHKGVSFDPCEEVLLCWTVMVRTARRAEEGWSAVGN